MRNVVLGHYDGLEKSFFDEPAPGTERTWRSSRCMSVIGEHRTAFARGEYFAF